MADQLKRFSELRVLDVSGNAGLDRASISLFIDMLQGKLAPVFILLCPPPLPHTLQVICASVARDFVELNLSSSSFQELPENIGRSLPKLQKLVLDDCRSLNCLPVALGSKKDLKYISVQRCPALVFPPRSQQLDPVITAKFLMSAYSNSENWRRVKVLLILFSRTVAAV
jgi:hypothetical protein